MNFILVDDELCIATHFRFDRELETKDVSSGATRTSTQVTVGQTITGEMLLFRRDELPGIFRDDGTVKKVNVEFRDGETFYTLRDVIFTAHNSMGDVYEKCEAAYFEYAATDVAAKSIAKDINTSVTL